MATTTRSTTRRATSIGRNARTALDVSGSDGSVVRASMAHHQGMTLVAIANALLDDTMVERFHADLRVKATELLLQERVPRLVPVTQPRPLEATRVAAPMAVDAVRRFRSAATQFPHAAFLSNGNYISVVTNAGGGSSRCRGRAVTRERRDATCDPGGQFIYLRDVRTRSVWSSTAQPFGKEPQRLPVMLAPERATFRRLDDGIATNLDIAVSTEDDMEVRRLAIRTTATAAGDRGHELRRNRARCAATDLAHPAFGKLFIETEYLADCSALLCRRRPGGSDARGTLGRSRAQPGRASAGRARVRNRPRSVSRTRAWPGRPSGARRALAFQHGGRDARSDRQPAAARPARARRLRETVVRDRDRGES